MNGEIRDREKVLRDLKKTYFPIVWGTPDLLQLFRPHMSLDYQTLADRAGINIE